MKRAAGLRGSFVPLLLLCLYAGTAPRADAAVFRDRAAFDAAAQNLRTIDFESAPAGFSREPVIDGVLFENVAGMEVVRAGSGKALFGNTVGEFTRMVVYLPPGTTAVGCEQFNSPMTVTAAPGESVTMNKGDGSTFVGFVSDTPMRTLTFFLDFPEPTPEVLLDDLSFGQRRAGNEPPAPLLLADAETGRAAAFDSVALTREPFTVNTPATRNLGTDGRTRVTLLLVGVRLDSPGDADLVSARAEDSQHHTFQLPVEAVGGAKNLSWMARVTVRLPQELSGAGDVSVKVSVRGAESNGVTLRVD